MLLFAPLSVLLSLAAASPTVVFFISNVTDRCVHANVDMWANHNTENGGLCAYIEDPDTFEYAGKVWACPAGLDICWAEGNNGQSESQPQPEAGIDICSTVVGNATKYWQCFDTLEICVPVQGLSNNCQSKWSNPLKSIAEGDTVAAQAAASSVVAAQNTQSASKVTGASFPTAASSIGTSTTSSTTSSATSATTFTIQTAGSPAPSTSQVSTSQPVTHENKSSSMTTGAKAGIGIGCAAAAIVGILAAVFLWRCSVKRAVEKRRQEEEAANQPLSPGAIAKMTFQPPMGLHPKPLVHEVSNEPVVYRMGDGQVWELDGTAYGKIPQLEANEMVPPLAPARHGSVASMPPVPPTRRVDMPNRAFSDSKYR